MPEMDPQEHWERIYSTKADEQLSWFEPLPAVSVRLLAAAGMTSASCVLDVSGGESRLVDELLGLGMDCVAVLDVSAAALDRARARVESVCHTHTTPWGAAQSFQYSRFVKH